MNFLAHLYLANGDDDLMLGALLGDFVRGRRAMWSYPFATREGIRLHRKIDKINDSSIQVRALQKKFPKEFRRYSGIIIDLAFDYELANSWSSHSSCSLAEFDVQVREVLARHDELLPEKLKDFMAYADRRGLFENYQSEDEMLFSLAGVGTRLKRANPLHRVSEIWPDLKQETHEAFVSVFPEIQSNVAEWRKRRSTTTGS
ncbi:MAG: acyl carrier protein phosphodiesterase [Lysobacterales bacterium]|jgi:acyl carrier protein phosphodiesterase